VGIEHVDESSMCRCKITSIFYFQVGAVEQVSTWRARFGVGEVLGNRDTALADGCWLTLETVAACSRDDKTYHTIFKEFDNNQRVIFCAYVT
jgi:hypothetical protein